MADQNQSSATPPGEEMPSHVSLFGRAVAYRHYALGILTLIYVLNYMDRQILSVLLPAIKAEFMVSDTLLGLLSGISFAAVYATLGIPIALLADRMNRRNIITISLAMFSFFTALCAFALNFWQLLLARLGVGVGEAGTSPPSHSIIADLYPAEQRSTALAIYALGVNFGLMLGFFGGGWINEFYGWRAAFLVAGVPGILLAIIVQFVLKEPPRGLSDAKHAPATPLAGEPTKPGGATFMEVARFLWSQTTFRHLSFAAALNAFVGYGAVAWTGAFLFRSHDMSTGEIGTVLAVLFGVFGGFGTFMGGYLADKLAVYDTRWRMWVLVIAIVLSIPFSIGFYLHPDKWTAIAFYLFPVLVGSIYLGPTFAMTQGLVPLRMRSAASAILLFIINMIGLGLGPLAIGMLSDALTPSMGSDALRWAMLIVGLAGIWSALHFLLAARTMDADLERVRQMER